MNALVAAAMSRMLSSTASAHHRHHDVQLELPAGRAAEGDRLVVAHHAGGHLHQALAHHRIDLAGHDRAAGLEVGQPDLVEAAARAGAQPADVVGHVEQRDGDGPQLAVALDQAVALGVGLEVVGRLDERDAGLPGEQFGDAAAELGMGVDAGADGRAADGQLADAPIARRARSTDSSNCRASPPISWPERKRRGVGQVRAADLEDVLPLGGLLGEHLVATAASAGIKPLSIATATATWIAVGKTSLVLWPMLTWSLGWIGFSRPEAVAARQLDGPVGDHLVGVHVAGGAGAGLKDVDGELVVELALGHLAAGGDEGPTWRSSSGRPPLASRPRSRLATRGRPLDQSQGMDQLRRQPSARRSGSSPRPAASGPP